MDGASILSLSDHKNTLSSRLVEQLRETILRGDPEPGSKINLERLRARFSVSLSPLREALARLIADGLVEFEDNRGYRVTPLSIENLTEITKLRTELECLALKTAICVGDQQWERDVINALSHLSLTVRASKPDTLDAWEAVHTKFHITLLSGCRLPFLLNTCRVLHNLNDRYRRVFLQTRPSDRDVAGEHIDMAAAAISRREQYACDRLRDHIQRTGNNLSRHLSEVMKP